MMREWYRGNLNPTTEEFKRFLEELNNLPVRQERSKVPLRRLKIWWRNEKQRLKRQQLKEMEKLQGTGSQEITGGTGGTTESSAATSMLDPKPPAPPRVGSRGVRADGQPRKPREKKNCRRSSEASVPQPDFNNTRDQINNPSSCFHSNPNKTFPSDMSVPATSGLHRPVYVNSPSDVGFHVRYLEDRPRSRNDGIVPNISSRGHLPIVGLNLQQQGMSPMNPHVYHLPDGLYSPVFHSCSVSNSSHASP